MCLPQWLRPVSTMHVFASGMTPLMRMATDMVVETTILRPLLHLESAPQKMA